MSGADKIADKEARDLRKWAVEVVYTRRTATGMQSKPMLEEARGLVTFVKTGKLPSSPGIIV